MYLENVRGVSGECKRCGLKLCMYVPMQCGIYIFEWNTFM